MSEPLDIRLALGSDLIGMILVVVIIVGNIWRLRLKNRESKVLIAMLAFSFSCCLSDLLAFIPDGSTSPHARALVYTFNTWLFVSNAACAFSWFIFLKEHFKLELTMAQRWVLFLSALFLGGLLVANFFYPLVFEVNEQNQYVRKFGYWIFITLNYGIIINSLMLYFKNYRQDGFIRFFPIWLYVLPIVVATIVQTLWYGVSLMSPCFAISIAGAFTALQNEQGFRDHLTGLFNRYFLDFVLMLYSQKGRKASGIMVSLRDFESINQKFGHGMGDKALCKTAEILHNSVGYWGSILRYSGDEFIVMVDSQYDEHLTTCIEKLKMNFNKFNRTTLEPYKLNLSIGFKKYNADSENADSFLDGLKASLQKVEFEDTVQKVQD